MQVEVTVVSKRRESTLEAPGVVTVHRADEIARYGYYTLADLADITPGYSSYTLFGERVLETRGQKAGSFNNKHLLLIDGIPVHHAKTYTVPTEYELPLHFAQQVEFLKGPSSALYGTSALLGVISVTPRTLDAPGTELSARLTVGLPTADPGSTPYELRRRAMASALHRSERRKLSVHAGYFGKRASQLRTGGGGAERPDAYVDPADSRMWDDQQSLFLHVSHRELQGPLRGLSTGLVVLDKTGGLGEFWRGDLFSHEASHLRWTTLLPYVKYERAAWDRARVRGNLRYNQSRDSLRRRGLADGGLGRLRAETIHSMEAAVAYEDGFVQVTAAGYFTRTRDSLNGVMFMAENVFENTSERADVIGTEVQVHVGAVPTVPMTVHGAWSKSDEQDGLPLSDVPVLKLSAGVGCLAPQLANLRAQLWLKWASGYRAALAPDPDGHVTLDANLIAELSPGVDLELQAMNLLDERFTYPLGGQPRAAAARRSVLLSVSFVD